MIEPKEQALDEFMSQVIDCTETEKEEVIRTLAMIITGTDFNSTLPSTKVMMMIIPLMLAGLTTAATKKMR